jgi:hypothetical protein
MITPTHDDIGRKVVYREIEEGVITSFNDLYVFVRYGSSTTSAATNPSDLEWSHRTASETLISTTIQGGKVTRIDFCEDPLPPS